MATADTRDRLATEVLFSSLYKELCRLARRELVIRHQAYETISPGSLLHDAYVVICERSDAKFTDCGHFMAYTARVMRGLIVDHARRCSAQKRGGQSSITSLDADVAPSAAHGELEEIRNALTDLTELAPQLAEIVDLKFFSGFSFAEIAAMRGVSERTVQRRWEEARLFLRRHLGPHAVE